MASGLGRCLDRFIVSSAFLAGLFACFLLFALFAAVGFIERDQIFPALFVELGNIFPEIFEVLVAAYALVVARFQCGHDTCQITCSRSIVFNGYAALKVLEALDIPRENLPIMGLAADSENIDVVLP